jgi:hypothetical protein
VGGRGVERICECERGERRKERGDGEGVFVCVRGREREGDKERG